MTTALQKTLQTYIDQNGLSVAGMERQAGLRINVVRNILRGQSKRPTAETLQALAKLMGCSIQDLLSEDDDKISDRFQGKIDLKIDNPDILRMSLDTILKICDEKGMHLKMKQIVSTMDEVYTYSIKKDPPEVDRTFVEWYLSKIIS